MNAFAHLQEVYTGSFILSRNIKKNISNLQVLKKTLQMVLTNQDQGSRIAIVKAKASFVYPRKAPLSYFFELKGKGE